ncbi:hypothetical protein K3001_17905, partial [Pseudomonas aeruginosa]|nr:hypothetical protein [Pseudomonas aeruginosa]
MIDTQYSLAATQAAIPSEPIAPGACFVDINSDVCII